ncbi:MAG: MaoC family dehydratase N-terminal domain-containing protein, partial [Alphaproteobacteria bacterium]
MKFSYGFLAAMTLRGVNLADYDSFDDALCNDNELATLAGRTEVVPNDKMTVTATEVKIDLTSGETISQKFDLVKLDLITARMVNHFKHTLGEHCFDEPEVPAGLHWCLAPDVVEPDGLGPDGHPKLGGFLPNIPYPRRMWAGGWLEFHDDFGIGDEVEKRSVIDDISFKSGNSGNLCFVAVTHEFSVDGKLKLRERHDIVYREEVTKPPAIDPLPDTHADQRWHVDTNEVMLFRYSALTFNGHRIHYDLPYSTGVEGHGGLLVHGPLQATLM